MKLILSGGSKKGFTDPFFWCISPVFDLNGKSMIDKENSECQKYVKYVVKNP
jgi:hypothetical protein